MEQLQALLGLGLFVLLCWACSTERKAIRWRIVWWGLGLQILLAAPLLLTDVGQWLFGFIDMGINKLLSFSDAGANFVFGTIEPHQVEVLAADGTTTTKSITSGLSPALRTIAFAVLPTVLFFSALMALFYHFGVMQRLVAGMAWLMRKTFKTSGAETLSVAANIFVGQTEAPLLVKPYIQTMTRSELHTVMCAGFATVAGGVMAIYVAMLPIEGIAGHLVTASVISAPAALLIGKMLVPETEVPSTLDGVPVSTKSDDANVIDAVSRGTIEGLGLFLNIVAMLFVFVAMVTMLNALLGWVGSFVGLELSMELIFGWVFWPFAWLMGVPAAECHAVGMLLGKKLVLTELMAYADLSAIQQSSTPLSERTSIIASYALCGFANFASIGIQIGGLSGMAPERRSDLARLGMRAMWGGMLAAIMTGSVVGLFL